MRRYVAGESGHTLGKAFGISAAAAIGLIRRRGVLPRDYSASHRRTALNDQAFSEVNEAVAYWVGMMMADGCMTKRSAILALAEQDEAHVRAFADFLGSGHTISRWEPPTYPKRQAKMRLEVFSGQIVSDLAKFGVVPRKAHIARVIGLEQDRHFWRGLLDGDGWISRPGAPFAIHMHGSLPMMEQFRTYLQSLVPNAAAPLCSTATTYRVAVTGYTAATVARALYTDTTVSLARKAARAATMLHAAEHRRFRRRP